MLVTHTLAHGQIREVAIIIYHGHIQTLENVDLGTFQRFLHSIQYQLLQNFQWTIINFLASFMLDRGHSF